MRPSYFRDRRRLVSGGAASDDVSFGPVEPQRIYHIARLAVEDETSAPTGDIRVLVSGHGYDHFLIEQDSPAAATLYWESDVVHLFESETLVARFTGAVSGDSLQLYLEGWYQERRQGFGDLCAVCAPFIIGQVEREK